MTNGAAAVDARLSGAISGSQNLTKTGDGTLQLTATNTYTGSTTVNAGRLLVDGLLPGAVTVTNSGVLGGARTA